MRRRPPRSTLTYTLFPFPTLFRSVRSRRRADDVEGVLDVGDPVAQGVVHGVLEGPGAAGHRLHLGAEQLHAEHVGGLALDVGGAHVDDAGQVEERAEGGRSEEHTSELQSLMRISYAVFSLNKTT